MGTGELPYKLFLSTLAKEGFDGWVSYEMCSAIRGGGSLENLVRYARDFLGYFEQVTETNRRQRKSDRA
jgi:sugar phosphate isomerase/epimerase